MYWFLDRYHAETWLVIGSATRYAGTLKSWYSCRLRPRSRSWVEAERTSRARAGGWWRCLSGTWPGDDQDVGAEDGGVVDNPVQVVNDFGVATGELKDGL